MSRNVWPVVHDLPSWSRTRPDPHWNGQDRALDYDSRVDDYLQGAPVIMATTKIDINIIQTLPDGSHVIQLGDMEIWDGADLALLRETLVHLFHKMRSRQFGVDMSFVKYVPSGFFGMLFDWYEKGVQIQLYSPQPQVAGMLWFRRFFQPIGEEVYRLNSNFHPTPGLTPVASSTTNNANSPQYQATH